MRLGAVTLPNGGLWHTPIDPHCRLPHRRTGEHASCSVQRAFRQLFAELLVLAKLNKLFTEGFEIPERKDISVDSMLDLICNGTTQQAMASTIESAKPSRVLPNKINQLPSRRLGNSAARENRCCPSNCAPRPDAPRSAVRGLRPR